MSVDLLYIFKNKEHPSALGDDDDTFEETLEFVQEKCLQYDFEESTFKKFLEFFPNIHQDVLANYLYFFGQPDDFSNAFIQLNEAIDFRSKNPSIMFDTIEPVVKENFFFYTGKMIDDTNITFFTLENHDPNNCPSHELYIQYLLYIVEKNAAEKKTHCTTLVLDRRNMTFENQDFELVRKIFYYITLLYPNSITNIVVYPTNVVTKMLFTTLKSFLHEKLAKVITLLEDEEEFQKWCLGKTGYPLVDAGMRELNQTGFMHNRVRMLVSSFLCKHLLIDWRWGEAYFANKLFDYEKSSNIGNWQWVAGCGADAQGVHVPRGAERLRAGRLSSVPTRKLSRPRALPHLQCLAALGTVLGL